jgi:Holliday junction resolvase RusA-like endonuclease
MDLLEFQFNEMPPSENRVRNIGYRMIGGKRQPQIVYTKEAEQYKARLLAHARQHFFVPMTKFARAHRPTDTYSVSILLVFPMWEVLTKGWLKSGNAKAKSPYKKVDGPNRQKLLLDAFSEALGIDDSLDFDLSIRKIVGEEEEKPSVEIRIERVSPRTFGVPARFLEVPHV